MCVTGQEFEFDRKHLQHFLWVCVCVCARAQEKHVNLIHIESRKSKRRNSDFEIFVDCDTDHEQFKELTELLRKHTDIVEISPFDGSALPEDGTPCRTFTKQKL